MDTAANTFELLSSVTATGASAASQLGSTAKTCQVKGSTTSGAGAATIAVQVTNDLNYPYVTIHTFSLTLSTTAVADVVALFADYTYIRLNVTAISGTGAAVSGNIAV